MGDNCLTEEQLVQISENSVDNLRQVTLDGILPSSFDQTMITNLQNTALYTPDELLNVNREQNKSEWRDIYQPLYNDSTTGYEHLNDAIQARHRAFKLNNPDSEFDRQCQENALETFNKFKSDEQADISKLKKYINGYLNSYKSLFNYKSSMTVIMNSKKNELNKIKNKIETYKQNLFIDSRKDSYQQKNHEFYKSIYFYVIILYYTLFVLYLIFSKFFKEKEYKNMYTTIAIILYVLAPILVKYLIVYIHKFYIYVKEYYNLREDIISYPHIIENQ